MAKAVSVTLPLVLVSVANLRECWQRRARRARQHRAAAVVVPKGLPVPCVVLIERLMGSRAKAMDDDNYRSACKALRDGIAARLGVDDADHRVRWDYAQTRAAEPGVRITITESA